MLSPVISSRRTLTAKLRISSSRSVAFTCVLLGWTPYESGQVSGRMQSLVTSWQSAKVVRTREKVSFFFGVMSVLVSALLFGMAPE